MCIIGQRYEASACECHKPQLTPASDLQPRISNLLWQFYCFWCGCITSSDIIFEYIELNNECFHFSNELPYSSWFNIKVSMGKINSSGQGEVDTCSNSFLHNMPWMWPRIKTIRIDWIFHFLRARVTVVWSLWRHQQSIVTSSAERKTSKWDSDGGGWVTGWVRQDLRFHRHYMDSLCRIRNKIMYTLVTNSSPYIILYGSTCNSVLAFGRVNNIMCPWFITLVQTQWNIRKYTIQFQIALVIHNLRVK